MDMGENRYWNPLLETLPRDELLQIEIDKFRRVMDFAIENSPIMAFIDILDFHIRDLRGED